MMISKKGNFTQTTQLLRLNSGLHPPEEHLKANDERGLTQFLPLLLLFLLLLLLLLFLLFLLLFLLLLLLLLLFLEDAPLQAF